MKIYLMLLNLVFLCLTLLGQKICKKNNCLNGFGASEYVGIGDYSGQFKEGLPHGEGRFVYTNGDKYLGNWAKGKKEGSGKYIFKNGIHYQGHFKNDFFDGQGTMYFKDQSKYVGYWKQGKRDGSGTLTLANGEKISGTWSKGQYQAEWDQLGFSGFEGILNDCNIIYCHNTDGKYQYQDGKKYLGNFKNGVPSGVGTVYFPNGDLYEGHWQLNQPNGKGVMYSKGQAVGAVWKDGKAQSKLFTKPYTGKESIAAKQVKIWAVIVGAADYGRMHKLDYTDDDALKIYDFLTSPSGGSLPQQQIQLLLDHQVTKSNVLHAVKSVYSQADWNDVILFYFSGHGVRDAFVPIDSDGLSNLIDHESIKHYIQLSRAKHKVVIADACHAGNFAFQPGSLSAFLKKYYQRFEATNGGIALLMSSRGDEYSYEDQRFNSGIFSYFLVEALRGKADRNQNGLITIKEAFQYVYLQVSNFTGGAQTPVLSGNYDANMPLSIIEH